MAAIRPLVAGNWKMNGQRAALSQAEALAAMLAGSQFATDVMLCPPATLLAVMAQTLTQSLIAVGAQDCHPKISGAHTGDISPEILGDSGASAVIVGHSERRTDHGERDSLVKAKAEAACRAGLSAILCIGETEAERRAGKALGVVSSQLAGSLPGAASPANTIIAYEPVWAIGTGLTPTSDDVAEVHATIRVQLESVLGEPAGSAIRVLYGGSVKGSNAAELLAIANVNGALVGGASLKAEDFFEIINVYAEAA